uniref:Uncharacterized protein n=1 Tax=Timema monikensis TaxID=170555 RepID=A0A7R9EID2_9NEOP|nr:unnamed protein product [Timema monikensis]
MTGRSRFESRSGVLISNYIFQQSSSLQQFRSKLTENLRMPATAIVSASEDTVWIADKMATFVHMNKTEFSGHCWSKVSRKGLLPLVKWQQLSAEGIFEDKGQLWMLTQSGDLFCSRPNSSSLHSLPLPCNSPVICLFSLCVVCRQSLPLPCNSPVICLAAAPFTVWLLTANSRVFIRQGLSDTCLDGFTWRELSLAQIEGVKLRHISCGCDAVWACDDQGSVYMAMGSPHAMADSTFSPVWIHADEKPAGKKIFFTKVYVGPQIYMVWAIDNKRNVYVREAIFHDFMLGVGWMLVSGIEATELSLSGSAVWALSPGGSVYRRHGITQNNFIGDYWKKIPGSLAAITSSVSDGLWALDKNNGLLKHSLLTVRLCEKGIKIVGDCLPATDDDWEVV